MTTGLQLAALAESHIGEKYENIRVPKNNSNWKGPWDCAEFVTWVIYQRTGKLFGCTNNSDNPAFADAYSGAWVRDAKKGTVLASTENEAVNTAGVILIREPPLPGHMGHVAMTDGQGKTIEAAGKNLGVRKDFVRGRVWHYIVKIPNVDYSSSSTFFAAPIPLPRLLTLQDPNMSGSLVRNVQTALESRGFNPGAVDGVFGPHTVAAVVAFQTRNRLVADGIVGPKTAKKLGVDWPKTA